MMSIDRYSSWRSILWIVTALAFLVWQGSLLSPLRDRFNSGGPALLPPTAIVICGLGFLALLWKPADRLLRRQLEDELTRHNWRSALITGYWAALLPTGAGLVLAGTTQISALDLVRLIFILVVTVPMLKFAILERSDGVGE